MSEALYLVALLSLTSLLWGYGNYEDELQQFFAMRARAMSAESDAQRICADIKAREGTANNYCSFAWSAHGAQGWQDVCSSPTLMKRGLRQERLHLKCPAIFALWGNTSFILTWLR